MTAAGGDRVPLNPVWYLVGLRSIRAARIERAERIEWESRRGAAGVRGDDVPLDPED